MPDRLTLKSDPPGDARHKINVSRVTDAGALVTSWTSTFDRVSHYPAAAKMLRVPADWLNECVVKHRANWTAEAVYDLPGAEMTVTIDTPSPMFRVRGIRRPASDAVEFSDIWDALCAKIEVADPVVEWDGVDEWCVVDIDFHEGSVPDADYLRQVADTLRPVPVAWWLSRSGGLHVLFSRYEGRAADGLAVSAAVSLAARFPTAGIEIKHSTRQPGGEVVRRRPTGLGDAYGRFSGDTSLAGGDVASFLSDRGLSPGERYPHEQCPVNPSPRAAGNSPPVCAYDDHIYCFICAADGVRRGSRTPGYFPLAKLCGSVQASMFRLCVDNFTHWQHAQHVVRTVVRDSLAEAAYRAALHDRHGDDPRIPLVFVGPKGGLIRTWGAWADSNGNATKLDKGSATLAKLPCCLYPARDKKGNPVLQPDAAHVEQLSVMLDLAAYGYPAITRIWGAHITQMQEQPDGRVCMVLRRNGEPEYLPHSRRMEESAAWSVLETWFPGLDRGAVELLIAAKGCSETSGGLPPMVFFYGPTGSGKSQTVSLAAAICGDRVGTVLFERERQRIYAAIREAKNTGSFAFFDEYLKHATDARVSPEKAMEIVLTIKPDTMAHILYRGPVALGDLPVIVFSDTTIPAKVWGHSQIARRVHAVHLQEGRDWLAAAGSLRTLGGEAVHAADSILSAIVDRHFMPGPPSDFADIAASLGFARLQDSAIVVRKTARIQGFFDLVCSAPKAVCRFSGDGWKCIDLNADGQAITDAWKDLADEDHRDSRAVNEMDLKRILNLSHCCKMEVETSRNKIYVRFKETGGERINEQLRCSVDGRRDPERDRPPQGGGASVSPRFHNAAIELCLPLGWDADHLGSAVSDADEDGSGYDPYDVTADGGS